MSVGAEIFGTEIKAFVGVVFASARYDTGAMTAETAAIRGDDVMQSALVALGLDAASRGANAIVNLKIESGPFQKSGSGYNTFVLIAYGDAIIVDELVT